MTAKEMERRGRMAIRKLRLQKLKQGHPFMINSSELPDGQCWLEYPDGHIHLVKLSKCRMDFESISKMSLKESDAFRMELGL
jgi:hypothetical protein